MPKVTTISSSLLLTALLSGPALADNPTPEQKAVKARQGFMQLSAFNIGTLAGMAKGQIGYDAEQAQAAADNLKLLSMMNKKAMWIPGTSNDKPELKTEALAKIWAADSEIGEKAKAYNKAAADMAAAAGQGLDALKAQLPALGKSCKGCHEEYRQKKK